MLHEPVLEAFVTNLGRYNEGFLIGEYLKLPATTEEVQTLLKSIGVDGIRYEEIFLTDYECHVSGLYDVLGEYESIDELNYLAGLIDEMDKWELEKFETAVCHGEHSGSVAELINLAQNLDCYEFYPNISDRDDLGRMYIGEYNALSIPESIINYFDFEAYGRDVQMEEGGEFVNGGYIVDSGSSFMECYTGREDIPEEFCIFAYPKLPIREQIAAFKESIPDMVLRESRAMPEHDR
ncbi:MAG: antirestriction protein ArdA [Oscillospiraceae bacterium]|nr:antirestriction protein ArdA [Oscillospiraceae bacterium]